MANKAAVRGEDNSVTDRSGTDRSGADRSGADRSGADRSGADRNSIDRSREKRDSAEERRSRDSNYQLDDPSFSIDSGVVLNSVEEDELQKWLVLPFSKEEVDKAGDCNADSAAALDVQFLEYCLETMSEQSGFCQTYSF